MSEITPHFEISHNNELYGTKTVFGAVQRVKPSAQPKHQNGSEKYTFSPDVVFTGVENSRKWHTNKTVHGRFLVLDGDELRTSCPL